MNKSTRSLLLLLISVNLILSATPAVFAAPSNTKTVSQTQTSSRSLTCKKADKTQTVTVSSRTESIAGTDRLYGGNITGTYKGTRKTVITDHFTRGKTKKTRKTTITTQKNYVLEISKTVKNRVLSTIDPQLADAWKSLGFSFSVTTALTGRNCRYLTRERMIQVGPSFDTEDLYQMMGHFLSFAAGNTSCDPSFRPIFDIEKHFLTGLYKNCASRSPQDFFAVCMRDYCLQPQKLMQECWQTYQYIQKSLKKLTPRQISLCKAILKNCEEK